jgi:U3 small nucleolar RNA-associated protein 3
MIFNFVAIKTLDNGTKMSKKRREPSHSANKENRNGFEERGGKLGPITTYEDVADSEDEFHIQRDKILLDEGPDAKRRRKWAEQGLMLSPKSSKCLLLIVSA